jgi:excisionase family DNA binding protein
VVTPTTRALAVVRGVADGVRIVGAARRLTLTVEEAAALIGISRAQAYRCVRSGQLRAEQLGRRIVVPVVAVEQLLGTTIRPSAADSTPSPDWSPARTLHLARHRPSGRRHHPGPAAPNGEPSSGGTRRPDSSPQTR